MLNNCVEKTAFIVSILTIHGLYFVNVATHLMMIAMLLNFKSSLCSSGFKGVFRILALGCFCICGWLFQDFYSLSLI